MTPISALPTFIKYFFICICSLTAFTHLLNIKPDKTKYLFNVLFSLASAGTCVFLRQNFTEISLLILAILLTFYNKVIYKQDFNISIVTSTISLGISFALFTLSIIIILPLGIIFLPEYSGDIFDSVSHLIVGVMENVFVFLIFKIRRLKDGMPFLLKKGANEAGVYISVLILFAMSFGSYKAENYVTFVFVFVVIFSGLFIYFWWRRRLYNDYLKSLNQKEMCRLKEQIEKQQQQIADLKKDNEKLAKIIHKDNKILPALILATDSMLSLNVENDEITALHEQIKQLYQVRGDALKNYEKSACKLAKTGILSTDGVIKFLFERASNESVNFDVSINASLKYLTDNIISEADLNTLLSDLVENAVIATKSQPNKAILLTVGIDREGFYRIDILDSGEPFAQCVLENLGFRQITTHKDSGGSGIGLVTVFNILKKYNASLVIEQNLQQMNFTKRVSVLFDNKNEVKY